MAFFVKWYAPYISPSIEEISQDQERFRQMRSIVYQNKVKQYIESGHQIYDDRSRKERGPYSPSEDIINMSHGWSFPKYQEPLRNRIISFPKKMRDIICTTYGYAVSQRMIDLIETFEPGVHQFLPFEFVTKENEIYEEKRWILNICSRMDTIVPELSSENILDVNGNTIWRNAGPADLVTTKSRVAGCSIWYEWRYLHSGVAVSDDFWRLYKKAKITGWNVRHGDSHIREV